MANKEELEKKSKELGKKGKGLWAEFKKFITRGNVLDMAVGVIIGGAFSAIVTALVNILLSVCTWGVPGGLKGLITVLPALNDTQKGVVGIGQSFASGDIVNATIQFAASQKVTITKDSDTFVQWQNGLKNLYTLHGGTYAYNLSAVIDWGTLINAVISFLIIAVTLFVIVKVATGFSKRRAAYLAKIKDEFEKKNGIAEEEAPAPTPVPAPDTAEVALLKEIRDELKKSSAEAVKEAK